MRKMFTQTPTCMCLNTQNPFSNWIEVIDAFGMDNNYSKTIKMYLLLIVIIYIKCIYLFIYLHKINKYILPYSVSVYTLLIIIELVHTYTQLEYVFNCIF